MKDTIIVIGAGAAGLMAARLLSKSHKVVILEAGQEAGGRILSLTADESVIEGGAEFIHGELPVTLDLLKEAGIDYVPVAGHMYRREGKEWIRETEMTEGWDVLIDAMQSAPADMTMAAFLASSFPGRRYEVLRQRATAFAEGFDLADLEKASVRSLYQEWSREEERNYIIPKGYGSLVQFLYRECVANGCEVLTGEEVIQVDWRKHGVTAYTRSGNKYGGEKAIITISLGALKNFTQKRPSAITPSVEEYIRAADEIGYGSAIKTALRFREPFWQRDAGFILSDEPTPTWWTKDDWIIGWTGGPRAEAMAGKNDREILDIGIFSLARLYDKTEEQIRSNLIDSRVVNWGGKALALGAYSYSMPYSMKAKELLNTPLDETLYFAGEALYNGPHPGTVEAALISGIKTAEKILKPASFPSPG